MRTGHLLQTRSTSSGGSNMDSGISHGSYNLDTIPAHAARFRHFGSNLLAFGARLLAPQLGFRSPVTLTSLLRS